MMDKKSYEIMANNTPDSMTRWQTYSEKKRWHITEICKQYYEDTK